MNSRTRIPTGVDKILTTDSRMVHVVNCRREYNCYLFQFSEHILKSKRKLRKCMAKSGE